MKYVPTVNRGNIATAADAIMTGELMRALQYVEHETCIRFGATTDFTVPYLSMVLGQR